MLFVLYILKYVIILENKVNKSSVGGEVYEISKRSKGNGFNEKVISYRIIYVDRLRRFEF